ncbi:uncharacterized protein LOC116178021 [Photinus pyralis]|uniref:uncharacterized protein LOC116178021 n=1 Tax=Photinus pyralis TaxID=7054 RepID=UPI001267391C|nr:uncharacterized protein LOC116178021 [Photinus pyralis]
MSINLFSFFVGRTIFIKILMLILCAVEFFLLFDYELERCLPRGTFYMSIVCAAHICVMAVDILTIVFDCTDAFPEKLFLCLGAIMAFSTGVAIQVEISNPSSGLSCPKESQSPLNVLGGITGFGCIVLVFNLAVIETGSEN